ncbi:hypothetical protein ABB37_09795 [Leptomonas pyrrhocoris]|uniref:Uncharacterized protein n=1 Tax=Leptomonas pyrrhocoris TaxID=157538 RepID=A0A0N0VCP5_LEPPY|nr:hypothetical protein ABB37_09795 [Leptomonas pyrrhocoris]KPA73471.1 hypothetical protein ABB37_09795 [Leptomonas pyrrhocoris]|eukprot:XP_015651910.1 hypothetical protein ABB37_09795 [Leptomonas pyrrhocoris]
MPAEKKPPVQPLSRSLSDSVDLAEFLAAKQSRSPGWLDAVSRGQSSQSRSASAANATASASVNPNSDNHNSTTLHTTQGGGSTSLGEHTPSTNRYPAEATAMGSPIPVDTDDSDANINQLISHLGARGASTSDEAHPLPTATNGGGPQHRTTPPPAPMPAGSAPQAASPPSPRPITAVYVPHPTARGDIGNKTARSITAQGGPLMPPPALTIAPPQTSAAPTDLQNFPFGERHNPAASAEQPTPVPWESGLRDITVTTDTSPHATAYSSALMQALSRKEGAAVLTSQWVSTTPRSHSYSVTDDQDHHGTTSSSAYPPDIYEEAMRAKVAKQQWMALERARQGVLEEARRRRDCPFAPQVSPYASRLQRPPSLRPENRVQSEIIRRKQSLAKRQQQEVERELRECTFRPLTLRAAQLDPAALTPAGPAVFHNLYAEAEDRRAFEAEVKPLLLRQMEGRVQPSPLRPERLAEVVDRLCARGVVRTADPAPYEGEEGAGAAPYAARSTAGGTEAMTAPNSADQQHQPLLSAASQRIVAAQVAAGERDPDIVRHLYRQAERDAMKDRLRLQLDEEKERVARAEQALIFAEDRRRLQQEYYRSVLAAKYRALAKYVSETQHMSYRAAAPQSVALLARASFDLLSTDETEELLSAVENCGQHKLREAEFVAVVFRYFAEQQVAPAEAALLTRPPPACAVAGSGAANAKRASSAPRSAGGGSVAGSPLNLPRIKREKPDPALIAQIRENRALALEEWKKEHQRRRGIAEGVVTDEDYPFRPAPRRLIPYECRPDVVVPVKMTKSEALRRAYIASRQQAPDVPAVHAPSTKVDNGSSMVSASAAEQTSTARELFSQLANTAEGIASGHGRAGGATPRARSRSGAAAAALGPSDRERSAARQSTSPAPRPQPRAASVGTRGPSRSPPQATSVKSGQQAALPAAKTGNATPAPYRARAPLPSSLATQQQQQRALSSSPAVHRDTAHPLTTPKPTETTRRPPIDLPAPPLSFVEQIMQSTPEERARLGRALLLRQLREHQRRRAV